LINILVIKHILVGSIRKVDGILPARLDQAPHQQPGGSHCQVSTKDKFMKNGLIEPVTTQAGTPIVNQLKNSADAPHAGNLQVFCEAGVRNLKHDRAVSIDEIY
jgi:hypothetical protein